MLDVREWGGVEQMRLQMKMTQIGSKAYAFFRVFLVFFFFFLGLGFFPNEWGQGPNLNKWSLALRDIRHQ